MAVRTVIFLQDSPNADVNTKPQNVQQIFNPISPISAVAVEIHTLHEMEIAQKGSTTFK